MAKLIRSDDDWRAMLPPLAYQVMRKAGTERAFTHDDFPKTPGRFHCRGCGTALFDAGAKFDSGTGWPSFWSPIAEGAIETRADHGWFIRRTEVLCAGCDSHLGHVFTDGPAPTGLRYCINGVALKFSASSQAPHDD